MRKLLSALQSLKLWQKVNGAILVTFAFIAVTYTSIELPYEQQRLDNAVGQINILLRTLVERDQDPLANEIFERRIEAIQVRLSQMRRLNGILEINVYGPAGELLESDGAVTTTANLPAGDLSAARSNAAFSRQTWNGTPVLRYFQDIKVIGDRIGFIEIYYSLADINHDRQISLYIVVGLLLSILVIMAVLLNVILFRTVVRPITTLSGAMAAVQAGDLGRQVKIHSDDEIGALSHAFNQMSVGLKEAMRSLADANVLLEQRVQERTAELEKLAMIDALTGLANRRYFEARAAIEMTESRRDGQPLTVLVLDIDHFKMVNDTHGHAVGDVVLQQVSQVLTRLVRPADLVARIGGEEFAIIIPGSPPETAAAVAERIRAGIEGLKIPISSNTRSVVITVTTSVGMAMLTAADPEITPVYVRADEALYRAKRAGRNRVIIN